MAVSAGLEQGAQPSPGLTETRQGPVTGQGLQPQHGPVTGGKGTWASPFQKQSQSTAGTKPVSLLGPQPQPQAPLPLIRLGFCL